MVRTIVPLAECCGERHGALGIPQLPTKPIYPEGQSALPPKESYFIYLVQKQTHLPEAPQFHLLVQTTKPVQSKHSNDYFKNIPSQTINPCLLVSLEPSTDHGLNKPFNNQSSTLDTILPLTLVIPSVEEQQTQPLMQASHEKKSKS